MQANTIPGPQHTQGQLVIVDIQVFYAYAERTVDLVELRRLWILKNKR